MISKWQFWLGFFLAALLGAVIALLGMQWFNKGAQTRRQIQPKGVSTESSDSFSRFGKIASTASMAVVNIRIPNNVSTVIKDVPTKSQSGSGVLISDDGYIVTNEHVINGSERIKVILKDKRSYTAKIIGRAPSVDLVLLKIDDTGLPFIKYGNSDDVHVGDWVLAIGNPFDLTSTVTAGIISAKDRSIDLPHIDHAPEEIESFLQTDAVVNPGNSGGALINEQGFLIGINTAIASETGNYEGYSFAVPVNLVKKVMDDLLNYGSYQRAYLGIDSREVDAKLADEVGLLSLDGVYVAAVKSQGAAEQRDLQEGDVIISVNDQIVNSNTALQAMVALLNPGDKVKIVYMRGQYKRTTKVTLLNRDGSTNTTKNRMVNHSNILGAQMMEISNQIKKSYHISHGLMIKKLSQGKLLQAGIKVGFVITHYSINGKRFKVSSTDGLSKAVNKCKTEKQGLHIEGVYQSGDKAFYPIGF